MLEKAFVAEALAHPAAKTDLFGAIRTSVEQMIRTTVPEGKTVAVIAHVDLRGHLMIGVAGRVGEHWEFDATLEKALGSTTPMSAHVSVIWSQ